MEQELIYNADLHFEHENWQRELDFWGDELKSFHLRLEELINRWTDHKVLAEIEKFQNQFNYLIRFMLDFGFDVTKDEIQDYVMPQLLKINELTPLRDGDTERRDKGDEDY